SGANARARPQAAGKLSRRLSPPRLFADARRLHGQARHARPRWAGARGALRPRRAVAKGRGAVIPPPASEASGGEGGRAKRGRVGGFFYLTAPHVLSTSAPPPCPPPAIRFANGGRGTERPRRQALIFTMNLAKPSSCCLM